MGWRFRRSLRIAPGIRLNLGSRGMTSLSLGGRGVTVNLSKRGTKTTYGLPGTGLSYQTRTTPLPTPRRAAPSPVQATPITAISRRRGVVYAGVGAAAFLCFLALRPSPVLQEPRPQVAMAAPPPPPTAIVARDQLLSAGTLSSIIPPAMAEEIRRPLDPPAPTGRVAVTTTGANVRANSSATGAIVKVLGVGVSVRVVAVESGWARVVGANGERLGWIHASLLRFI